MRQSQKTCSDLQEENRAGVNALEIKGQCWSSLGSLKRSSGAYVPHSDLEMSDIDSVGGQVVKKLFCYSQEHYFEKNVRFGQFGENSSGGRDMF